LRWSHPELLGPEMTHLQQHSTKGAWQINRRLFASAVEALDTALRHRQGVYEYTADPACLFRVQDDRACESVALTDGTHIHCGDHLLNVHLWNEHIPPMGSGGATMSWACKMIRQFNTSLCLLSRHISDRSDLSDLCALRADIRLATSEQSRQLVRICRRFGFEFVSTCETAASLRGFGENVLMLLLVAANNPAAVGMNVLWRSHNLAYLSRATLNRRHSPS
jgi:hypothetical protein